MKCTLIFLVAGAILIGACRREVPTYTPMKLGADVAVLSTTAR
jgi:hypothetical protein